LRAFVLYTMQGWAAKPRVVCEYINDLLSSIQVNCFAEILCMRFDTLWTVHRHIFA